jgi:hypothetical protein
VIVVDTNSPDATVARKADDIMNELGATEIINREFDNVQA